MQAPLHFAVDNRLPEILERLAQLGPQPQKVSGMSALDQLLYSVIAQGLSAPGATASYRRLRRAYPGVAALRDASPEDIRQLLVGVPAAALKAAAVPEILIQVEAAFGCLSLDDLAGMDSDSAQRFLIRLPRVTEDIARAVLALSGQERLVLTIDKDTARPLRRLALCEPGAPQSALPRQLIERAPTAWRQDAFAAFSRGLFRIADRFCHPGKPDCRTCPLASLCPTADKQTGAAPVVVRFPFGQARQPEA